ncbi:MAG TPA: type II toxin-antitoxin system death-on-curing family toxin [Candidatus Paceibacterota bacterium]|nr:type II toxin-antitoxin system death-on-curing family toxin [Candidatus Paceibacterota bacterium]
MTEKEKPRSIRHLSKEDITDIYLVLFDRFKEIGEPIPPFKRVNQKEIENLVIIPQTKHFGVEQYPTIESKAAILFYKINKGHIFPNGNKRISLACLFVFLDINDKRLEITEDEATAKAIEIANSDPRNFDIVKEKLELWIKTNMQEK